MIFKIMTYLLHLGARIPIYYILFVVDSEEYEITSHDLQSYYVLVISIIIILLMDFLLVVGMKLSYVYGILSNILTAGFIYLLYIGYGKGDATYYGELLDLRIIHIIYIAIICWYILTTGFYIKQFIKYYRKALHRSIIS